MNYGYYTDVFLKRMNYYGETRQERIASYKEIEFDRLYLRDTMYQGAITSIGDESTNILCSIQPNKWNEDKILSYIFVSTRERKFKTGDVLKTHQEIKERVYDKIWLVVFVNQDITHGYQSYKVIELDSVINFTDEYGDTKHIIPVKIVNESSVFVQDTFTSYGSVSEREPKANRKFLTSDYSFLEKAMYFDYKKRGWEISGIDNLSVNGVAYVSFEEKLVKAPEPKTSEDILVGEDTNFFLNHD